MNRLYMKQNLFSLSGKFTVKDMSEKDVYFVEGSFLKIPKTFTILNASREEVAHITKKVLSLLPKFHVDVNGKEVLTIKKEFSMFKSRYTIVDTDIEMRGNWWDMDFTVFYQGEQVGEVHKKWLSWGDSYEISIHEPSFEIMIIALVVAIDCVKSDDAAASNT
ncbi:LURP-one-related/scramblase family protein [Kurthia massiliensis]|uniref:LURP-one-related/scramblase family protein n=1 Tax=Kurthia massiliensis TaxID=1033739 RepID=UPI000287E433|nr:LURP-one-related family protein [Kurthia massiliensis]